MGGGSFVAAYTIRKPRNLSRLRGFSSFGFGFVLAARLLSSYAGCGYRLGSPVQVASLLVSYRLA